MRTYIYYMALAMMVIEGLFNSCSGDGQGKKVGPVEETLKCD